MELRGGVMIKDLTGKTFGSASVEGFSHTDKNGHAYFNCKCLLCDRQFCAAGSNLLSGKIKSCGCIGKNNREHGRMQTLHESFEYGTNIGRIRSNKPLKNSTTGIRGVYYVKSRDYYQARIAFQGKRYVLKTSKDIEVCIEARKQAEQAIFGEFLEWYDNFRQQENEILDRIATDSGK